MHEKQKLIERVIVGLVVTAVSINILASQLPRLLPYLIVGAAVVVVLRLVWFYTNR